MIILTETAFPRPVLMSRSCVRQDYVQCRQPLLPIINDIKVMVHNRRQMPLIMLIPCFFRPMFKQIYCLSY